MTHRVKREQATVTCRDECHLAGKSHRHGSHGHWHTHQGRSHSEYKFKRQA